MSTTVPYVSKSFTSDGTVSGYLTVDTNTQFLPGAAVFLASNTQPTIQGIVTELSGAHTIGFRIQTTGTSSGRTDISAYKVADGATVTQVAQTVFGMDFQESSQTVASNLRVGNLIVKTLDDSHHTVINQNAGLLTLTAESGTTLATLDEAGNMVLTGSLSTSGGGSGQSAWKQSVTTTILTSVANMSHMSTTQNGITLANGNRVLLVGGGSLDGIESVSNKRNGIYVVGGVSGGFCSLTRSTDANSSSGVLGMIVPALDGNVWHCTSPATFTLDTDPCTMELLVLTQQAITSTAGLPSNTLTPVVAQIQTFYITLDSDLTVAAPTGSAPAGSIARFSFKQDSTGYHKVTWNAAYKGAGRFLPRQGPLQGSEIRFVSNGDGTFSMAEMEGIDLNDLLNVMDWGATGDGTTDDQPALQAAMDYAQALQQTVPGVTRLSGVRFPAGIFALGRPLLMSHAALKIEGAGSNLTSFVKTGVWTGPALIIAAQSTYLAAPIPTTSSHLTGLGNGWTLDDGTIRTLNNANEWQIYASLYGTQNALNGNASFCAEASFKPTAFSGAFQTYIAASTGRLNIEDDVNTQAFALTVINDGRVLCTVNVAGSEVALLSSVGSLVVGNWYHVAISYDGSTVRLFLNGTMVSSASASGTISQSRWETIVVGAQPNLYPAEGAILSGQAPCVVDFVRVSSNTPRYTSNFTPPTAKPTPDNFAVFQTNFEVATGFGAYGSNMILKHYIAYPGLIGSTPAYSLARRTIQGLSITGAVVKGFNFATTSGIEAMCLQQSRFEDISFGTISGVGIYFVNNCFTNNIVGLSGSSGIQSASYGFVINASASGVNRYSEITLSSSAPPFVNVGSSVFIKNAFVTASQPSVIGDNGGEDGYDVVFDNYTANDEGSTGATRHLVLRNASLNAFSCLFEKDFATDTSAPIVLSGDKNRTTWYSSMFNCGASQVGIFEAKTLQNNPVVLINPLRWIFSGGTSKPLNTTPLLLTINDLTSGHPIVPTGGSASAAGQSTLVGGTVTVSTTAVTASSIVMLTHAGTNTTNAGILSVGTITAGTSFVINSSNASDTDKVNWWIIN